MDIPTREDASGMIAHAVPLPPQALPAVAPDALMEAWRRAANAARAHRWGPPRSFLFPPGPAGEGSLHLTDRDACCWAASVDGSIGLDTLAGVSLCLRLLALVELLGRAPWTAGLFDIGPLGIELDPRLLDAAATHGLDGDARFDEKQMRRLFSRILSAGVAQP